MIRREEQEERMRILTEQILVLRTQVRILTQDSPLATHVYPSTQGEWSEVEDWKDWKERPWRSCQSHHKVFPTLPEHWTLNIQNTFSGRITEHAAQLRMNNILLQNQIDSINTPPKSWKTVGDDKNQSDKETKSAFMSLHCNWAGLLKGRLQKFYTPEDRGRGALPIWKWPTFGQNKPKTGPNLAVADVGIKLLIGPIFLSLSGNHLRRHLKLSA